LCLIRALNYGISKGESSKDYKHLLAGHGFVGPLLALSI
jgi:hypothetical protein